MFDVIYKKFLQLYVSKLYFRLVLSKKFDNYKN